jgi:hypothetical protein
MFLHVWFHSRDPLVMGHVDLVVGNLDSGSLV